MANVTFRSQPRVDGYGAGQLNTKNTARESPTIEATAQSAAVPIVGVDATRRRPFPPTNSVAAASPTTSPSTTSTNASSRNVKVIMRTAAIAVKIPKLARKSSARPGGDKRRVGSVFWDTTRAKVRER